jgi:hypothetical protein
MVAVRNLLSSLNSLAHSGLLASGWLRHSDGEGAMVSNTLPEPDGAYMEGGVEPPLNELFDDPVIHLMMRADRLEPEEVRSLLMSRQLQAEP